MSERSPFLNIGVIWAIWRRFGNVPVLKLTLNMSRNGETMLLITGFIIGKQRSSCPGAEGDNLLNIDNISESVVGWMKNEFCICWIGFDIFTGEGSTIFCAVVWPTFAKNELAALRQIGNFWNLVLDLLTKELIVDQSCLMLEWSIIFW